MPTSIPQSQGLEAFQELQVEGMVGEGAWGAPVIHRVASGAAQLCFPREGSASPPSPAGLGAE